jgi:hypothetical protein
MHNPPGLVRRPGTPWRAGCSRKASQRVHTLFNLAGAQSQTGRLVEAAENYRKVRDISDDKNAQLRTDAANQLELIEKQLAQVTLDITNIGAGDLVTIDDIEFPQAALRQPIPMNPGSHVTRVQRGTSVIATRMIRLISGATESIRIELPVPPLDLRSHEPLGPRPLRPLPPLNPDGSTSSRGWLRSPWLWSGVAVVLAGGAAGAYFFSRSPDGVVVR